MTAGAAGRAARRRWLADAAGHDVERYARLVLDLRLDPASWVAVVIDADDDFGGLLARSFLPDQEWGRLREPGKVPVACGLVDLRDMAAVLRASGHRGAGDAFARVPPGHLAVCAVTAGGALVGSVDLASAAAGGDA